MPTASQNESKSATVLSMTRIFDASPERVFDAWLDPSQYKIWMGPRAQGASTESVQIDPRVGGKYSITMRTPKGDKTVSGAYRELVRPTRLVFTWHWQGPMSCASTPEAAGAKPSPPQLAESFETLVTVTFTPAGKGTEMTLLHENFADEGQREGHSKGWACCFDQMADFLAAKK
jgi:uncharacterized protein YndB with AHSA1/START domain